MGSIGFFYNLHVNLESFLYSVMTVKKYAPDSPIITFSDTSLNILPKYIPLCEVLSIPIFMGDVPATYIDSKDPLDVNLPKMQEYVSRLYAACIKMPGIDWLIRMEDDVYMRRPIKQLPETHAAGNHPDYGMGGGSALNTAFFKNAYENGGPEYIERKCRENPNLAWAGDGLLRSFILDSGGTYSKWKEITEDWYSEDKDAALHHGDKSLYDKSYLKQRGLL